MKDNTGIPIIPIISPVEKNIQRPLWSVMVPVYNCIQYLPQTLQSIINQNIGPAHMQIEVVDDASTDGDVAALVQEIGKGRISYFRQPQNVGSLKNFETCLQRSKGKIIHLLHGDDFVLDGYYDRLSGLFHKYPTAGAAFSCYQFVDEQSRFLSYEKKEQEHEGLLENWLLKIARRQRLQYCAISVKREVYEKLGGFYGVNYGEDWEMWTRIAAHYPVAYTPKALASYRRQKHSISGAAKQSGKTIKHILWVIEKIQDYLPDAEKKTAKDAAIKWYSRYTMSSAFSIWKSQRDARTAIAQMKRALKLKTDFFNIKRSAILLTRIFFQGLLQNKSACFHMIAMMKSVAFTVYR